ncbi:MULTISPECIES: hypothetical protein [unclassified Mycolicibacterium]|uniref:hypothetical protein n=1 Tax=unclassified Mycolicibacterium TaxID=2636767 RepID=UPI001305DDB2|nr:MULTISPECIES: hypothetical protein [unclassified Mycolicibacterium]MUL81332.1 hypothetical protein [Mycolicibacterium sp. CBMA 329]MUL87098.1 hypothetical protein [Mycolicibacterium sp. CBMA 331]MUL98620.1 hypothetical protein [Mycolicibacterium sp. CBMA 334]MUM29497.1 hypothetical protein [Mycolicibacterium sp. CBMA 295]MUM37395.1 hypothetical protein [Mycolicibacterium sp. CBMA 247]
MAASVDVAARLDEGQAAVDTIAEYVWACHLLGFLHPDLTRHRYQVRDWYATEDGLDLRVLDTECAALTATAAVADQALQLQDSHFQNLSQAWQGTGAQASADFLSRHATSAAQVATGIRGAAATLARLRDNLWQAVDAKATAAVQIEGRQAGRRDMWLAAARTVSTGVGDRSAASELIDKQVKPFVSNDIGGDWLTAMRGTTLAVADAYADAIAALRAEALPVFGIPGDLGPAWVASSAPARTGLAPASDRAPETGGGVAMPAGFTMPPASAPVPPATTPAGVPAAASPLGAELISPAGAPFDSAVPALAQPSGIGQSLGGGGLPGLGGVPDVGSGLSGIGRQLADLFGGLIGSTADGSAGSIADTALPGQLDIPGTSDVADDVDNADEPDDKEEDHGSNHDEAAEDAAAEDGQATDVAADGETVAEDAADVAVPAETAVEPQPAPPTVAPLVAPVPPGEQLVAPGAKTPCEIAADELPQVGG